MSQAIRARHTFFVRPLTAVRLLALTCVLGLPAFGTALHAQPGPTQPGPGVSERSTPINAVPEKREQEKDETAAFRHSATVQKLGHMIGMSTEQSATVFEVLNFVVLAAGVGYLALKIFPKAFRDRSSNIQRNLVDARSATEEANARLNAVEARLGRLDEDIAGMLHQAALDAERDEVRSRESIAQETAKILAAAEGEIVAATAAARRELQRHAAELAIESASRRLSITAETDRLLVEGFAQRLAGTKGGQN